MPNTTMPRPFFFCQMPLPPSVNQLHVNSVTEKRGKKVRGRAKSKQYALWLDRAGRYVNTARRKHEVGHAFDRPFYAITAYDRPVPKNGKARDLDNCHKALFDILEAHRIFKNDHLLAGHTALWRPEPSTGQCMAYVYLFDASDTPLIQFQLIDADAGVGDCRLLPIAA